MGSISGLSLRMFVNHNLNIEEGFYVNNTSLVNYLASLFLGILLASDIHSNNLLLLFYVGFLGCFSTFSSFIYQLFVLIQRRKLLLPQNSEKIKA